MSVKNCGAFIVCLDTQHFIPVGDLSLSPLQEIFGTNDRLIITPTKAQELLDNYKFHIIYSTKDFNNVEEFYRVFKSKQDNGRLHEEAWIPEACKEPSYLPIPRFLPEQFEMYKQKRDLESTNRILSNAPINDVAQFAVRTMLQECVKEQKDIKIAIIPAQKIFRPEALDELGKHESIPSWQQLQEAFCFLLDEELPSKIPTPKSPKFALDFYDSARILDKVDEDLYRFTDAMPLCLNHHRLSVLAQNIYIPAHSAMKRGFDYKQERNTCELSCAFCLRSSSEVDFSDKTHVVSKNTTIENYYWLNECSKCNKAFSRSEESLKNLQNQLAKDGEAALRGILAKNLTRKTSY